MSATTTIPTGGVATFSIKVGGSTIPDDNLVLSIVVETAVNKISKAKITLIDGDPSTGTFEASSSSTFVPGGEVEIQAGYDSQNKVIFKGIITKQNIQIDPISGSQLVVECRDEAIKMVVGRKCLTFSQKTDSDIISSIIGTYSGLSSSVSSTSTTWPEQIQYYSTDWDFILARAEANGLIITTINGKVSVQKPDANSSSVLELEYGNNVIEFNADLNSITQLGEIKAFSWDYKTQNVVSGQATNNVAGAGNISSKKLSEVINATNYQLQTSANLEEVDLTDWSKAAIIKSEYSKIQGMVKCQGTSTINPACYITLKGVGDRFSGDHIVSSVTHTIADGNWITETGIGLSPIWFTEEPDVMAPPAAGLLPGVRGLFNGTVKKMHEDPNNQLRILVNVPLFDQNGEGIWARLTNFYSTSGAGAFFLPEVGDEVVIGFLNEDPRFPIILGSLYSNDKIKPFEGLQPNEKNTLKAIVSKSGINMEFDDENKILTLKTPGSNTMVFNDKEKTISIKDENGNSLEMSDSGITMKSEKDITIEASENLTLKGEQGVKIQASTGDVTIDGMNISMTADTQYSVNGGEMAKINSGAELSLNSGIIMIN